MKPIDELKIILRENDFPFFSDEEIEYYLNKKGNDLNKTAYDMLIIKSESTALVSSGLEVGDTSKYFRRLAQKYRTVNSRVLGE